MSEEMWGAIWQWMLKKLGIKFRDFGLNYQSTTDWYNANSLNCMNYSRFNRNRTIERAKIQWTAQWRSPVNSDRSLPGRQSDRCLTSTPTRLPDRCQCCFHGQQRDASWSRSPLRTREAQYPMILSSRGHHWTKWTEGIKRNSFSSFC